MKNILILLLIFSLTGCKVRDVRKSNTEEKTVENIQTVKEVKKEEKEQLNLDVESKEVVIQTDKSKEITLTVVDSTKPITVVDEKGISTSYFNANVNIKDKDVQTKKDKDIKDTSQKNTTQSAAITVKENKAKETQIKQQNKEVHSKPALLAILIPYLIWFFIVLILYLIWRYRKKIPYIRNFFS